MKKAPIPHVYSGLAMFQNQLDRRAALVERQGRDGNWIRTSIQNRLGLRPEEFEPFREYVLRLTTELEPLQRKTHDLIHQRHLTKTRTRVTSNEDNAVQLQMHQLSMERDEAIHSEFIRLEQALDPTTLARFAKLASSASVSPREFFRRQSVKFAFAVDGSPRKPSNSTLAEPLNTVNGAGDESDIYATACLDDEFTDCDFDIGAGFTDSSDASEIEAFAFSDMSGDFIAKSFENQIIAAHTGLGTLSALQLENMALLLYGPYSTSNLNAQYYVPTCVGGTVSGKLCQASGTNKASWQWITNSAGNSSGVTYANTVRADMQQ